MERINRHSAIVALNTLGENTIFSEKQDIGPNIQGTLNNGTKENSAAASKITMDRLLIISTINIFEVATVAVPERYPK